MNFDIDKLAARLNKECPEIIFVFLHGSAKDGEVKPESDIDLALFIQGKPQWELFRKVMDIADSIAPDIKCDIGLLNEAEPVYRFEALTGRMLFCRDQEKYLNFFSLTCRQYESQIADYERQKKYRLAG